MGQQATNLDQSPQGLGKHGPMAAKQKQYECRHPGGRSRPPHVSRDVGAANPYEFVAAADLAKGDKKAARKPILIEYQKIGGDDRPLLKSSPHSRRNMGQPKEAAATLNRINYIYPVHDENAPPLGDLVVWTVELSGAIREYQCGRGAESARQGWSALQTRPGRIMLRDRRTRRRRACCLLWRPRPGIGRRRSCC